MEINKIPNDIYFSFSDFFFAYPRSPSQGATGIRPWALQGIRFSIPRPCKMVLLGANGSGKSTLLKALVGLCQPNKGSLVCNGVPLDYSRKGLQALRQRVGLVLQDPDDQLFGESLFQDVSFGPSHAGLARSEVEARVESSLRSVGLWEYAKAPLHQLSHGMRKRAAIAGILAMHPEVLAMDEPTAGLDPRSENLLRQQLDSLVAQGLAVVLATHDVDWAYEWAEMAVVLEAGQVLAVGNAQDLLGQKDLMEQASLRRPRVLCEPT